MGKPVGREGWWAGQRDAPEGYNEAERMEGKVWHKGGNWCENALVILDAVAVKFWINSIDLKQETGKCVKKKTEISKE